ncbi:hypothetical protein [Gordonia sp. (in: high G+C Gram-positive bacteria)]|uniref:hypothetical protein n=1 Tax=Gordonia sp. (in: high G+C Gram-positive bacteria) TaxID=84139 RepID=UPI003C757A6A
MDNYDDGLGTDLERLSAQTIAHGSQLVEAFVRRLRSQRPDDRADQVLSERVGLDPRQVEDQQRVAQWVRTADPERVAQMLDATDREVKAQQSERWSVDQTAAERTALESSAASNHVGASRAATLRDSIHQQIQTYGLDPESLQGKSTAEIADELRRVRTNDSLSPIELAVLHHDGKLGDNLDEHAERDAVVVRSMLNEADMRDRESRAAELAEQQDSSAADRLSRSERVEQASTTPAAKAGATAARDHPTNPAKAVDGAAKQAPKARAAKPSKARQRAHAGR